MFRTRAIMNGSQQKRPKLNRANKRVKQSNSGGNLAMWFTKANECFYHIIIMHTLNVISKRIKASSRDVIMEEIHMKENMRLN